MTGSNFKRLLLLALGCAGSALACESTSQNCSAPTCADASVSDVELLGDDGLAPEINSDADSTSAADHQDQVAEAPSTEESQFNGDGDVQPHPGCTLPTAMNFDPAADLDDGSCITAGQIHIGTLTIATAEDLAAASAYRAVDGNLVIESQTLQYLNGLQHLEFVTGNAFILNNVVLKNLQGLSGLRQVQGSFYIQSNQLLPNLNGLTSLTEVRGNLIVYGGTAMLHLQGLEHLKTVGQQISLESNPALVDLEGLSGLTTIGASFYIVFNSHLQYLEGATALNQILGTVHVYSNLLLSTSHIMEIVSTWPSDQASDIYGNAVDCSPQSPCPEPEFPICCPLNIDLSPICTTELVCP